MVDVVIRKWGNSLGVVLPKDFIEKNNLKEADKITVEIKKLKVRDIQGLFKGKVGMSAQEVKDNARKDWEK